MLYKFANLNVFKTRVVHLRQLVNSGFARVTFDVQSSTIQM